MDVTFHETADSFLATVGAWLEREEAMNSLMLGLAGNISAGRQAMTAPPALMAVTTDQGPRVALLMTIPPRWAALYSPAGDELLDAAAQALLGAGHQVRGCIGPAATAAAFAHVWQRRTGQKAVLKTAQRIYGLREVIPPSGVPGRLRPATMADLDVAAPWRHRFSLEAMGGVEADASGARAAAERAITAGQVFFWEHAGRPVSQAVAVRPTRHGICIGGVYTPPEHRRRGYASACVAALSQLQLDSGREFCALYTDLANPTSNSIYRRIGYVPVGDSSHFTFGQE